ncbi:hypothetical protein CSKR_100585 [Clonorchis sinensis]|uniref:Uncharacterized protein n=1 Tax=Clonorchis sinensis TaxID=79923 RepID=A0A419PZV6_CLOSI|nr:hypothetical protein CSKR_100585 [Clonorchis sinensis]
MGILTKVEHLDHWAEYLKQELSWPPAAAHLEPTLDVEPCAVNVEPPTTSEVCDCICSLKRHRDSSLDDLSPALFKDGGEVPRERLSDPFACTLEKEAVQTNGVVVGCGTHFQNGARNKCIRNIPKLEDGIYSISWEAHEQLINVGENADMQPMSEEAGKYKYRWKKSTSTQLS